MSANVFEIRARMKCLKSHANWDKIIHFSLCLNHRSFSLMTQDNPIISFYSIILNELFCNMFLTCNEIMPHTPYYHRGLLSSQTYILLNRLRSELLTHQKTFDKQIGVFNIMKEKNVNSTCLFHDICNNCFCYYVFV